MSTRQGKRASQREFEQGHGAGGTCPADGKSRYLTKAAAKRAIKRLPGKTSRLQAYACGDFWHVGRPPQSLVRGEISRDEIGPTRPREPFSFTPKGGKKNGNRW